MLLAGCGDRPPVVHVRTGCRSVRTCPMGRGAATARVAAATEFPVGLCPQGFGPGPRDRQGHSRAKVDAGFRMRGRLEPLLQTLTLATRVSELNARLTPILQMQAPVLQTRALVSCSDWY